jgi:hypothetical protein
MGPELLEILGFPAAGRAKSRPAVAGGNRFAILPVEFDRLLNNLSQLVEDPSFVVTVAAAVNQRTLHCVSFARHQVG